VNNARAVPIVKDDPLVPATVNRENPKPAVSGGWHSDLCISRVRCDVADRPCNTYASRPSNLVGNNDEGVAACDRNSAT